MRKRQKRTFEITRGQIFLILIMAAVALTAVFEIGVSVGKKRVIEAEQEAAQRNDITTRPTAPASDEKGPSDGSTPDQAMEERKPAQQNKTSIRAASQIPTGGEFPAIPPQDQAAEEPKADGKTPRYTVQVGTFRSSQNAEALVALLKSYEYRSWSESEPSAEETLYSVFVGGFNTRDEAKQFGSLLRDRLSFVTGYMVREIKE